MNLTVTPLFLTRQKQSVNDKACPISLENNRQNSTDLKNMPCYIPFFGKENKNNKVTLADYFQKNIERESEQQRLIRIRDKYYSDLEKLSGNLSDDIVFDVEYSKPGSIKSTNSTMSKIKRSGTLGIPDRVRATIFVKDIYDLKVLTEKILPKLSEEEFGGYIIANDEEKDKPDISIRLNAQKDEFDSGINKENLGEDILQFYDGPQKSGYEDIQMRLVRKTDTKKPPFKLELLILFGKNYAEAKHIESDKVYGTLRQLEELKMELSGDNLTINQIKAKRNIDLIKQKVTQRISEVLYKNAKNKDLFDIEIQEPIEFTVMDYQLLNSYFVGLNDRIKDCYTEKIKKAKSFKKVDNLNTNLAKDLETIKKVRVKVMETIEYFTKGDGAVKNPEFREV